MLGFLIISQPLYAQISYPTYRMTNGVPDASGILVSNPTPNGGLLIYNSKNGQATMAPMKIREFQPEDNDVFNGRIQTIKEPEMTFTPEVLPDYRPTSQYIAPIPMRTRLLDFNMPDFLKHNPSLQINPVWNNPILEEKKQGDFNLRQD
ncbi:hypothetical protein [Litoribacter populi]|uniref:hypothetical protein n=1 Tax=Litoribacter populi TaxID=2598460 RepID=UPI00163D7FBC|nr:hypothetical protein [Litoribacter populi]